MLCFQVYIVALMRAIIIISMKTLQINANLAEIQSRLNKYSFLSKNTLPGAPDARVFTILQNTKRFPDRKANPNFYHWYILMKQFSSSSIAKWTNDKLYHYQNDSLINEFTKLYCPKKGLSAESSGQASLEYRNNKNDGCSQIQYSIDIALKDYDIRRINQLRRLLDDYKAEMAEQEFNGSKHICIVCKIDPKNLQEFSGKISKCIEFNELSLRKRDRKPQKVLLAVWQQQKLQ